MRTRKLWVIAFFSLAAGIPSISAEIALPQVSPRLSVGASLRTRGEFYRFFEASGAANDDYAFGAAVLRFATQWRDDSFDLMVEGQNSSLFGLPDDAVAKPPQGALGLGAVYFLHNRARNDSGVFLKQAFVKLKRLGIEGLSIKGGRFEFADGAETSADEPTLDWLKSMRIQQRLVGNAAWTHVGRSFDGITGGLTRGSWNVTLFAAHPTQGLFDLAGNHEISDIDVGYLAINLTRPEFAPLSDARLFYVYYADSRRLLKTDNRPLEERTLDRNHIEIHTEGAHYLHVLPIGAAGSLDFLAWGALQQGQWGFLDHEAWVYDLEAGWQPPTLPGAPWLRVGYGRSSGDDDPADNHHRTFFQVLPTARIYGWSAFYNLENNEDGFVQLILRPAPGLVSRTDFHSIRLTEGRDLYYQGSGASLARRDVGFGFSGRPAGGRGDLFRLIETALVYDWNARFSTSVYYVHLFGGGVIRSLFAGDDADFGYVEATIRL